MAEIINKELVSPLLPKRDDNANKYTYGRVLNIAGSDNYIGAACLSSTSALKIGAGYVTLACPNSIVPIASQMTPELTFLKLNVNSVGGISSLNKIDNLNSYDVISIGCGLSVNEDTEIFVLKLLKQFNQKHKIVLDADAINNIANSSDKIILKNTIITPHSKELSRLLKASVDDINNDREKYAVFASKKFKCITVLKGHNTVVTDGKKVYINSTGSSALSKAGTGDVLTGIIAGLLAQKVSLLNAALLGVYLHGLSGDISAEILTKYSVLASDVIEYLPLAIKEIL